MRIIALLSVLLVSFFSMSQSEDSHFPKSLSDGNHWIKKNEFGLVGITDAANNIVVPFTFQNIYETEEGIIVVKQNKASGYERTYSSGFYSKSFQVVLHCNYRSITGDGTGKLIVSRNQDGKYGIVDTSGYIHLGFNYDDLKPISEDVYCCQQDNRYGFIYANGKIAVPFEYTYAESFSNGLALATKGKSFGFIDKRGRFVISEQYEQASAFEHGYAVVQEKGLYGLISTNNTRILPAVFSKIEVVTEDRFIVWFSNELNANWPSFLQYDSKAISELQLKLLKTSTVTEEDDLSAYLEENRNESVALIDAFKHPISNQVYGSISVVTNHKGQPVYAVQQPSNSGNENTWNYALLSNDGKQFTDFLYFEIIVQDEQIVGLKSVNGEDQKVDIKVPEISIPKKEIK